MIRIFKTMDGRIQQISQVEEGSWVALTNPTYDELCMIAETHQIDLDDLKSPLDEEERSRIQVEDDYTLIILDIPTTEIRENKEYVYTIPFGIIFTDDLIFTVCLEDTPVLTVFMDGRMRNFYTYKKTRFIYQMLYRNAAMFLQFLRIIDKKSDELEKKLHISQRNQELLEMLELEKSLVYITTSLRGNEVVLEKLMRNTSIPRYEDDEELLEDVIIENKQAIEMAKIYSDILSARMDAFASVISNNLNIVMKFLSVITIVLTIPTIVTSALGMNVGGIPFARHPQGFWIMVGICIAFTVIAWIIIARNKYFK
ncbi:MAG: magnesium transporter CorA family protein [Anaerobutyricum sp.]|nr:magnesium transporter CorA family protein [Eubacterium sp.]MDY6046815.1 magnesium transporter CorA family protein [Anaerobutyricum sp.]